MTDRYAVIGNPVSHTKSPALQTAFARQCGQDMEYSAILAPLDGFVATVRAFQCSGGRGMNITVPFKLEAFDLANELTPRARSARAVNTFSFLPDGGILGDNTDGCGIVRDITRNLGYPLAGKRILILGAGGAARGALLPILNEKPAALFIANRTAAKAVALAADFDRMADGAGLAGGGFAAIEGSFDVIINATAASMTDEVPPLPAPLWQGVSLAYDMFYQAAPTAFLRHAQQQGVALTSDGLGMVVEQGAESFYLWRGVRPDTAPVIAALRKG